MSKSALRWSILQPLEKDSWKRMIPECGFDDSLKVLQGRRERIITLMFQYLQSQCQLLSCVQLFATLWTVARPWNSPGKNTGVGCHFLFQGIFPIQGSNRVFCIAGRFFTVGVTLEVPVPLYLVLKEQGDLDHFCCSFSFCIPVFSVPFIHSRIMPFSSHFLLVVLCLLC